MDNLSKLEGNVLPYTSRPYNICGCTGLV